MRLAAAARARLEDGHLAAGAGEFARGHQAGLGAVGAAQAEVCRSPTS